MAKGNQNDPAEALPYRKHGRSAQENEVTKVITHPGVDSRVLLQVETCLCHDDEESI